MTAIHRQRQKTTSRKLAGLCLWSRCGETSKWTGRRRTNCSLSSRLDVVKLDYRQTCTRRIAETRSSSAANKLGYVSAYRRRRLSGTVIGNTFRNHAGNFAMLCPSIYAAHRPHVARVIYADWAWFTSNHDNIVSHLSFSTELYSPIHGSK